MTFLDTIDGEEHFALTKSRCCFFSRDGTYPSSFEKVSSRGMCYLFGIRLVGSKNPSTEMLPSNLLVLDV